MAKIKDTIRQTIQENVISFPNQGEQWLHTVEHRKYQDGDPEENFDEVNNEPKGNVVHSEKVMLPSHPADRATKVQSLMQGFNHSKVDDYPKDQWDHQETYNPESPTGRNHGNLWVDKIDPEDEEQRPYASMDDRGISVEFRHLFQKIDDEN